jgi:uncharacterized repeat protein (TIGR03803 family)
VAGLTPDGHGKYFGVTNETDITNGTVFELSPAAGGGWALNMIYTFQGGDDGANPNATLAMDAAGNLYGETSYGGNGKSVYCNAGCGTVFELSPNGTGGWSKTTIYNFQGNPPGSPFFDGSIPGGGLVLDRAGNLYGTTLLGGESCSFSDAGCGVVFELSPSTSAGWTETIIHKFYGQSGADPQGGVILDAGGKLYGTTYEGGPSNCGTVFELSPKAGGLWTSSVLHTFNCSDGWYSYTPSAGLVMDSKGNLYGTTPSGGFFESGVAFELERSGSTWKEVPIFQFNGVTGGYYPLGPLTIDSSGNLYGVTEAGPAVGAVCPEQDGCGMVFKLTQSAGKWQESTVYAFKGQPDGTGPSGPVILDSQGNIFGVTAVGGTANLGAVYEITP